LGGGQLGRMFGQAAQSLGYRVHVYEPAADCPASAVANRTFTAPYEDAEQLAAFARTCAVVTYEFENIPVAPLQAIAGLTQLHPRPEVLEICQNRLREKRWLKREGFPHVPFAEVEAGGDLAAAIRSIGVPCVVKTADFGYDGKGQQKVTVDQKGRGRKRSLWPDNLIVIDGIVELMSFAALESDRLLVVEAIAEDLLG
jgi:5-(carboxyamino)imidazole ribonucleotide synthase